MPKRPEAPQNDADLQTRLGAAVRSYRQRLGITQEELAWRADMHRTYIADIERGARNVTLRSIAKLAEALELSVAALFSHLGGSGAAQTPAPVAVPNEVSADAAPASPKAGRSARL